MEGLKALHAVDAAGVHPLLLAIGKERYMPYQRSGRPQEILKAANAIPGFGHASFAKYLFITAEEDNPGLDVHNIQDYFRHVLERVDWRRDLHFQTETTIDSLDYTGTGLNEGSKVIIAARGDKRRNLSSDVPLELSLPSDFCNPRIVFPGVLAVQASSYRDEKSAIAEIRRLCDSSANTDALKQLPLILVTEDSEFIIRNINNFLWVTFTRSNPSHDIHGVGSFINHKHWGCTGPLVIDVRLKPHHAPPLIEDPKITRRVDALGKVGGCLHGII